MKKLLVALTLLFLVAPAFAEEKPVWVEASGEAYQGEAETPIEVKARAKRDAEQKAVEQAVGVFIKAHTFVSNAQIADDMVYAAVRGKINKVEVLSSDWDNDDKNIYRVKIKALIEPVLPEKGAGFGIKLSLSKTELKEGDEVRVFYEPSADCYVYIFSVAADGSVTLLFPNSINTDNGIKSGKTYTFPSDVRIKLKAELLPGYAKAEEKIKIIATRKKEDIVPLGFQEGFFKVYDAKSTGMISDLAKKLNQLEPIDWAEAQAVYRLSK